MSFNPTLQLENALTQLLAITDERKRQKIMRKIAGYMSRVNKRRAKLNVNPDGSAMIARKRKLHGSLKMFVQWSKGVQVDSQGKRHRGLYHVDYDANLAAVSFKGYAGKIAVEHQTGSHPTYHNYPRRELLGFSDDDQQKIADMILHWMATVT